MRTARTYGYNAVKLSNHLTLEQLVEMAEGLRSDPANQNTKGGIWLYTKATHRRLDAIAWAITYKLQEKKQAASY